MVIFVEFIDQLIDYPINHASLTTSSLQRPFFAKEPSEKALRWMKYVNSDLY